MREKQEDKKEANSNREACTSTIRKGRARRKADGPYSGRVFLCALARPEEEVAAYYRYGLILFFSFVFLALAFPLCPLWL